MKCISLESMGKESLWESGEPHYERMKGLTFLHLDL